MADRPRFFDDLAGVAGNAMSVLAGAREEIESLVRARLEEAIRRLDLVKREELEAFQEIAAKARAGQEAAETKLHDVYGRLAALEGRMAGVEARQMAAAVATVPIPPPAKPVTEINGPGMIA